MAVGAGGSRFVAPSAGKLDSPLGWGDGAWITILDRRIGGGRFSAPGPGPCPCPGTAAALAL